MRNYDFAKGLGIGVIAGATIGMAIVPKRKCGKSVAGRALRAAGDIVENISDAIGL